MKRLCIIHELICSGCDPPIMGNLLWGPSFMSLTHSRGPTHAHTHTHPSRVSPSLNPLSCSVISRFIHIILIHTTPQCKTPHPSNPLTSSLPGPSLTSPPTLLLTERSSEVHSSEIHSPLGTHPHPHLLRPCLRMSRRSGSRCLGRLLSASPH